MTWISIAQVKTFTLQVFREYPLSPQGWTCPQEYWTVSMCQQFLSSFQRKWARVLAWSLVEKKHVLACLYVLVCVVVLQNENFEGKNLRRPWVNSNNFSNEKNFLRSLNFLRETWKRSTLLGRMSLSCQALDLFQKGPKGATSRRMRAPILLNSRHHSDDSHLSGFDCDLSPMASGPEVRFQEKHLSTKD